VEERLFIAALKYRLCELQLRLGLKGGIRKGSLNAALKGRALPPAATAHAATIPHRGCQ
jgi:hypothetical protein